MESEKGILVSVKTDAVEKADRRKMVQRRLFYGLECLYWGVREMIVLRILIWILMASILVMLITFSVLLTVYMINHRDVVYKEGQDDQETAAERKR